MKEVKEKVHMDEILDSEIQEPRKVFVIGEKKFYADRTSKEQLSTHRDCKRCSTEFEKRFTYDNYCPECTIIVHNENYNSLPVVDWDFKTPLCLYNDDVYFFDIESILEYCEDNDCEESDLRLVTCRQTSFSKIDYDMWADDCHEDWEPEKELISLVDALNNYLEKASTNSWIANKVRANINHKNS